MSYNKILYILFIFVILFSFSCSTPYQPKTMLGGYSEEQIKEDVYKVKFAGNQHTGIEKVQQYLLYRCAELADDNGFEYYQILDELYVAVENAVLPTPTAPGISIRSKLARTKVVSSPYWNIPTTSTAHTNMFVIKFVPKVTDENYQTTISVEQIMDKYAGIVK